MLYQKEIYLWFVIIWSYGVFQICNCINILGIVTSSSKSNHFHASAIFNNLANNGHSVRVLSPHSQSQKIHHLFLDGLDKYIFDTSNSLWHNSNNDYSSISKKIHVYNKGLDRTKAVLQHKSFKKLLTSSYTVDIIIIDYDYNEALLGLAKYFNCPVIILYFGQMNGSIRNLLDLSYPFRYLNFYEHKNENSLALMERSIHHFIEDLFINFYYHPSQKTLYENIFTDKIINAADTSVHMKTIDFDCIRKKSIAKILISTPLLGSNLQFIDIVDVTGVHLPTNHDYFDNNNENRLSQRLDNFIHSADDGVIYVSFGADINPSLHLSQHQILTIFQVLDQRTEKILWSWNGNTTSFENSKNFLIQKLLPQNEILKHSNVKAFITSGGVLSLIEAIHYEIPIIGIPITQEQSDVLDEIVDYGLGIKIEPKHLTIASLTAALNEIIENDRYRDNLFKKSQRIQDRPLTPMKTVKYWIEHIYRQRHSYKTHQNNRITDAENNHVIKTMPSHLEYYFLNVYLISFIILVISVIAIVLIIKFIYNLIFYLLMARRKIKMY